MSNKSQPRQKIRVSSPKPNTEAARSGTEASAGSPNGIQARIAALAYQFYEQRGREPGHELEDWIQAEKRILAET